MDSGGRDQAEQALLRALHAHITELKRVFEESSNHWGFEDPVYRFYHQSFKLYSLQQQTQRIVGVLGGLLPERTLHPWFVEIVREGTGKKFVPEANAD